MQIHTKKIGYSIIQSFFLFYYNEQTPVTGRSANCRI